MKEFLFIRKGSVYSDPKNLERMRNSSYNNIDISDYDLNEVKRTFKSFRITR